MVICFARLNFLFHLYKPGVKRINFMFYVRLFTILGHEVGQLKLVDFLCKSSLKHIYLHCMVQVEQTI